METAVKKLYRINVCTEREKYLDVEADSPEEAVKAVLWDDPTFHDGREDAVYIDVVDLETQQTEIFLDEISAHNKRKIEAEIFHLETIRETLNDEVLKNLVCVDSHIKTVVDHLKEIQNGMDSMPKDA